MGFQPCCVPLIKYSACESKNFRNSFVTLDASSRGSISTEYARLNLRLPISCASNVAWDTVCHLSPSTPYPRFDEIQSALALGSSSLHWGGKVMNETETKPSSHGWFATCTENSSNVRIQFSSNPIYESNGRFLPIADLHRFPPLLQAMRDEISRSYFLPSPSESLNARDRTSMTALPVLCLPCVSLSFAAVPASPGNAGSVPVPDPG